MCSHIHAHTQAHRHIDTETQRHTDTQTHRHTDTQTHRHTDTQTHRLTDTQTHRHTDTHTHIHTDTQTHRHTDTQTDTHTRTHARTLNAWFQRPSFIQRFTIVTISVTSNFQKTLCAPILLMFLFGNKSNQVAGKLYHLQKTYITICARPSNSRYVCCSHAPNVNGSNT